MGTHSGSTSWPERWILTMDDIHPEANIRNQSCQFDLMYRLPVPQHGTIYNVSQKNPPPMIF